MSPIGRISGGTARTAEPHSVSLDARHPAPHERVISRNAPAAGNESPCGTRGYGSCERLLAETQVPSRADKTFVKFYGGAICDSRVKSLAGMHQSDSTE